MTKRERMERDDAEMRALYESFGVSPAIIEAAIRQRHLRPVDPPSTPEANLLEKRTKPPKDTGAR